MWTLYTSSGDVVLLSAIFNFVAMVANNTVLVWGFALFAATLLTTRASVGATIEGHRGAAGPVLTRGAYHMVAPVIVAMLFTSSDMKVTLTIENTTTGVTSQVANVPIIIAAIPVGGSAMSNALGPVIVTGMSGVNPVYGDITVAGHGFIDPMRRLLAARGSVEHLGSADTELRMVVGDCISAEAGTDFAALNRQIMNSGNSGATAAQSIPINGASPTGVGAMLYVAAQNTTALVPELNNGSATILNCADAAALVASDLTDALQSVEFSRVVQGAVNGLDQPLPGADYSVNQLGTEYSSLRNWKSESATIQIGQQQANAELINFLFDEEVSSGLNCAQAAGSDKTQCEAIMIQATELERNNLQAAANEVPMLEYAGAFGNYILALIIGLGPVIVMFMMLFGVDGGKVIKTAMHIVVWPLLVTNVGAELVNAMLTMQFSNFMNSVSQGGVLSPAEIHNAYKELSLQVGVGSHIMASLPVLMSMIFALGEAAGLASVAAEVTPKGNETGKAEAPSPVESAPLMRATSPSTLTQGVGWSAVEDAGRRSAASGSSTFMSYSRSANQTINDSEAQDQRESQERTSVRRFAEDMLNRKYSTYGINDSQGDTIRNELMNNAREGGTDSAQTTASNQRSNNKSSEESLSDGYSGGVGVGGKGGGAGGLKGGLNANGSVNAAANQRVSGGATDSQALGGTFSRLSDVGLAKVVSKTLSSDAAKSILKSDGGEHAKALSVQRSAADSYVQSVSSRREHMSSKGQALQKLDGLVGAAQNVGTPELAHHAVNNPEFRQFQITEGNKFESSPAAEKHMAAAEQDMESHSTEDVGGDPRARSAVLRHMAAVSMARDDSLPESSKFEAAKYLAHESNAMNRGNFQVPDEASFKSDAKPIPAPKNTTGFSAGALRQQATGETAASANLQDPKETLDPRRMVQLSSNHGVAQAASGILPGFSLPNAPPISNAVSGAFKDANASGLAAGKDSKSLGARSIETLFEPSMSGSPALVDTGKVAANDPPPEKK